LAIPAPEWARLFFEAAFMAAHVDTTRLASADFARFPH
jgi:hypothetical protein